MTTAYDARTPTGRRRSRTGTPEGLVQLIRQHMDETGRSTRNLADSARAQGHAISHGTISNIASRAHSGGFSDAILGALAAATGHTHAQVVAAADTDPLPVEDIYVPPPESVRLTDEQRRAVDAVIRAMTTPTATDQDNPKPTSEDLQTALHDAPGSTTMVELYEAAEQSTAQSRPEIPNEK